MNNLLSINQIKDRNVVFTIIDKDGFYSYSNEIKGVFLRAKDGKTPKISIEIRTSENTVIRSFRTDDTGKAMRMACNIAKLVAIMLREKNPEGYILQRDFLIDLIKKELYKI